MCFNVIIVNPTREKINDVIKRRIYEKMHNNDDGGFMYADGVVLRTLNYWELVKRLVAAEDEELIHIHLRARTMGKRSVKNVHGWRVGNYYVSHNGYVFKYYTLNDEDIYPHVYYNYKYPRYWGYGEGIAMMEEESDSYKLFHESRTQKMVTKLERGEITIKELRNYLENEGLSGVVLMNRDNEEVAGIGIGKSVKVGRIGDILIISNDPITDDYVECNTVRIRRVRGKR